MIFSLDNIDNPYPSLAAAREKHPVFWDEGHNAWIVLEHDLVRDVFKDSRFSSDRVSKFRGKLEGDSFVSLFNMLSLLMLQRDEPAHTRLRNLVHYAFKRAAVENYDGRIRELAGELLAPACASGELELVSEFAVPLPILVISEIVGIPAEDRAQVKAWCDDFSVVALNFYASITEEQLRTGADAVAAFTDYLREKVETLHREPKEDLLSALVHAEEDGDRLTLDELVANTMLLLNAGNETTTCLLTKGMMALLQHPDQMARLRREPALVPNAVEELMRFDSPVQFIGRLAISDIELGGKAIRKGETVLLALGAAGRDPKTFEKPDELLLDRHPIHHVSFGSGHHICAGLQLSRLEARIAFQVLLETFSDITLATDKIRFGKNVNLRCPEALPLSVTAAP
jgi:cytochrome P450